MMVAAPSPIFSVTPARYVSVTNGSMNVRSVPSMPCGWNTRWSRTHSESKPRLSASRAPSMSRSWSASSPKCGTSRPNRVMSDLPLYIRMPPGPSSRGHPRMITTGSAGRCADLRIEARVLEPLQEAQVVCLLEVDGRHGRVLRREDLLRELERVLGERHRPRAVALERLDRSQCGVVLELCELRELFRRGVRVRPHLLLRLERRGGDDQRGVRVLLEERCGRHKTAAAPLEVRLRLIKEDVETLGLHGRLFRHVDNGACDRSTLERSDTRALTADRRDRRVFVGVADARE